MKLILIFLLLSSCQFDSKPTIMSSSFTADDFISNLLLTKPRGYSLIEALKIVETFDKFPTGKTSLCWSNSITGKPVIIGRTGGTTKLADRYKKKPHHEKYGNKFLSNQILKAK